MTRGTDLHHAAAADPIRLPGHQQLVPGATGMGAGPRRGVSVARDLDASSPKYQTALRTGLDSGGRVEFNPTFLSSEFTKAGPSVFGKLTWRF